MKKTAVFAAFLIFIVSVSITIGQLTKGSINNPINQTFARYGVPYRSFTTTSTAVNAVTNLVMLETYDNLSSGILQKVCYTNGGTDTGSWLGMVYGPLVTEDTIVNSPLLAQTASSTVGNEVATSPDCELVTNETAMPAGRYYIGVQFSDSGHQYIRTQNTSITPNDSAQFSVAFSPTSNLPSVATTSGGVLTADAPIMSIVFKQP